MTLIRVVGVVVGVGGLLSGVAAAIQSRPLIPNEPERVSIIQLIATPERYEGHRVVVQGFCRLEFEEQALYLHREDSDAMNSANGLWLAIEGKHKDVNDRFVLVEGVYTSKSHGHLGAWPGEIRNISRLERAGTRADYMALPPPPPKR